MLRCGTLKLSWKESGSHTRGNDTIPGKELYFRRSKADVTGVEGSGHWWENIYMMEVTSLTELLIKVLNYTTSIIQSRTVQTFQCLTPNSTMKIIPQSWPFLLK